MRGNYISPSELLQAQRETGKSYWDLIGQPLTPAVGYNINNPYSESEKSYKQWYNTDAKQTTQQDTKASNDQVLNELIQKYNNLQASMNKPKEQKEYEYDDLPSFKKGKDKFTSFAQRLGPKIYKEMNRRGVYSDAAYDNVMRQLAMESSYGQSDVALKNHNYGGVGFNGKTYFNYKNDDAFVKDYIRMMKSKYGAALKAKNTTQYAKALKVGGYYQDSLENYTNKLNAMSSMSAAAKRHRLLNPKMYEYQVLLSDMEEPAVSTRVEKPINKEPVVNTPIQTETPLVTRPEYLESNSLIKKSFMQNMSNLLQGKEFQLSLPGFKGGKGTIYPLGVRYWQTQSNTPTILQQKNAWVKQQKEQKDRDVKALRKYIKTEGTKELNKQVKDYLTTSNATTWTTSNKNPKNPHLQDRVIKGAKAHASWEKEHPVLNTWGNVLGALPFAVAAAPLAATAGSSIAALGDAAAATSAGQAAIEGLTPLATAASTNIAGAPLYTWADAGLSSLFGAHGIQTAINEGGISPTTALEIAPLGRLAKPMLDAGKQGLQYITKATDNATRYASPSYDLYRTVDETPIINRSFPIKSLYRADVYRGGEIKDPHNISLTTDPKYAEQYGEVTPYLFESNSIAKAKEPLMGYKDPVNNDMFIYRNTKDIPTANAIVGHDLVTGEFPYNSKGTEIISLSPDNIYPKPFETPTIEWTDAASTTPKVNWDADNWFKTISGRNSYSSEEAAELASHVPEYRAIEQKLFDEGKLDLDSNGNIVVIGSKMSPQEYIMRQSRAFQKMNPEHHYVGVSKDLRNGFENESRDPVTKNRYEVWTDRKSPKNVEEYAESRQGGSTNDSNIERFQDEMAIREENYKLHQEQLKWKYEHGKISQETYNQDLKSLKDRYTEKQKEAQKQLDILVQQKLKDPLNGGKVFDVTYPKEAIETPIINAENKHWTSIPFDNIVRDAPSVVTHYKQRPYNNKLQTDQVVSAARRNGYDVTHIDNVMDTYNGTMMDETIIGRNTPVKSVLGNTGNFDIESPNKWRLYRSVLPFLPFGVGLTGYGLLNNHKTSRGSARKGNTKK